MKEKSAGGRPAIDRHRTAAGEPAGGARRPTGPGAPTRATEGGPSDGPGAQAPMRETQKEPALLMWSAKALMIPSSPPERSILTSGS